MAEMLQREGGKSFSSLNPRAGAYIRANHRFKERSTELYTLPLFNTLAPIRFIHTYNQEGGEE